MLSHIIITPPFCEKESLISSILQIKKLKSELLLIVKLINGHTVVNNGAEPWRQVSWLQSSGFKCHSIWPLNAWFYGGQTLGRTGRWEEWYWQWAHSKQPQPQSTPSGQSTPDWSRSALLSLTSISFLLCLSFFPTYSSVASLTQSAASLDQIWHLVVKHRLCPMIFPLIFWLNLTLTSAF